MAVTPAYGAHQTPLDGLDARVAYSHTLPNERCSCQALFGCGFAAMVVACLQLN